MLIVSNDNSQLANDTTKDSSSYKYIELVAEILYCIRLWDNQSYGDGDYTGSIIIDRLKEAIK